MAVGKTDLPTYPPAAPGRGLPAGVTCSAHNDQIARLVDLKQALADHGVTFHAGLDGDGELFGSVAVENPDRAQLSGLSRVLRGYDLDVDARREGDGTVVVEFVE